MWDSLICILFVIAVPYAISSDVGPSSCKTQRWIVSCQKGPTRHAYSWQMGPYGRIPSSQLYVQFSGCSQQGWLALQHDHFPPKHMKYFTKFAYDVDYQTLCDITIALPDTVTDLS